jgi:PPOX class probable F420-dependent enzyme
MDIEAARSFVSQHHHAVLATVRGDGSPQLSPVTAAVDGEGRFVVSSRETAYKVRNLRREPRASLCVFTDRFFGEWVQVDGSVDIVALPEALELLVEYYRSVSGEHPDWDDYRAAMVRDRRVMIRITAERVGPDRAG